MAAPIRGLLCVIVVGFLLTGLYDLLRNFEENKCEMTWMYEEPQFLQIKLSKKVQDSFPRYRLFFYGEGGYARTMKKTNFGLTGVPVLFIPGNSGSYKQVRSLGSVAQRKSEKFKNFIHFNYFSLDLKEEFSGLYGQSLFEQTQFVSHCIKKILKLYKSSDSDKPTSVILVGHSMGGMIARAMFTLPSLSFDPLTVRTIITQATPHQGLFLMPDYQVSQFYKQVNNYWRDNMNGSLRDVTVVSTGGGFRDFQIRQDLTSLEGLVASNVSVSTSTMSVPMAWVSTDHLCAVWCRQMVLVTERALFDTVNRSTQQESNIPENKMSVFRNRFLLNPGSQEYLPKWEEEVEIIKPPVWETIKTKQWHITKDMQKNFVYLKVPITSDRDKALVAISNAKLDNWVLACNIKTDKDCESCVNLSPGGRVIPPLYSNRRFIELNLKTLSAFTHVVFVLPRGEDKATVSGEIISRRQKDLTFKLPGFTDYFWSFPSYIFLEKQMFSFKGHFSVLRNISFEGFDNMFKIYNIYLNSSDCKVSTDEYEGSVMRVHYPQKSEDTFSFIKQGLPGQIALKRQSDPGGNYNTQLHLFLQPGCTYTLSIKLGLSDIAGQIVRYYSPLLPGFIIGNILMAFIGQLRILNQGLLCPPFLKSLSENSRPYNMVLLASVIRYITNLDQVKDLTSPYFRFPEDDSIPLSNLGVWSRMLPFFLSLGALGVLTVHVYLMEVTIRIAGKVLSKIYCCPSALSLVFRILKFLLIAVAIGLSVFVCGTLGIIICYWLQFIKILGLRRECEKGDYHPIMIRSKFNFHFTLFLLQLWFVIVNAIPLLVWVRQLEFSPFLVVDSSRLPGTLFSIAYFFLSTRDEPVPAKGAYSSICFIIFLQVTGIVLYAVYSQYRLSYVLCGTLVSIAIKQFMSSKAYQPEKPDSLEKPKTQ